MNHANILREIKECFLNLHSHEAFCFLLPNAYDKGTVFTTGICFPKSTTWCYTSSVSSSIKIK